MKFSCSVGIAKTAGLFSKLKGALGTKGAATGAAKTLSEGRSLVRQNPIGGYAKLDANEAAGRLNRYGFLRKG
jgi:hypothetical protein